MLRKSRKRRAAGKAAKAVTVFKLAQPVGGAIKAYTRARTAKGLAKRAPGRRPLAMLVGVLGAAGVAAALKRRGGDDDLGYGPPNESHPSHETLAPSQAAAGQAGNGDSTPDVSAGGDATAPSTVASEPESSGSSGEDAADEGSSDAGYSIAAAAAEGESSDEPAGPPGDEAGSEEPGREERAETT